MGIEWHGDDPGFKGDLNKEIANGIQNEAKERLRAELSQEDFNSISFSIRPSNTEAIVHISGPEPTVKIATAILLKYGIKNG